MFRKSSSAAPAGYFRWEAAGLDWLRCAQGAAVVAVEGVAEDHLDLERLTEAGPTAEAAEEFGRQLAHTHRAGAPAYGSPPDGWTGDGFFGPLSQPLPLSLREEHNWGHFLAEQRIRPIARRCRDSGALSADQVDLLDRVADRCAAGDFDTGDEPARIHGDLWAGNVMWTAAGVTLIDPSAHGGHREADLAMLELFGAPYGDRILAAYDEAFPLVAGRSDRVRLHQLYPLAVHALLFGGPYPQQTEAAARAYA